MGNRQKRVIPGRFGTTMHGTGDSGLRTLGLSHLCFNGAATAAGSPVNSEPAGTAIWAERLPERRTDGRTDGRRDVQQQHRAPGLTNEQQMRATERRGCKHRDSKKLE